MAERDSEGFSGEIFLYAWTGTVVCTWGAGWEHVSVAPRKRHIMPSWDDMCAVKDLFFEEEEAVIQIHPPKSEYINNMPNCLHLWRCAYKDMVLPPSILVGVKKGQSKEEIDEAIKRAYELPLKDIGDAGKECDDRR
ncbi:MAG: hypothetical protein IIY21_21675 [Clostridiales bacterium]|nr:hypothetical protein [Clostridiales bacterium]